MLVKALTAAAMALDLGAHGVIAPYIETVSQVKELVGAVKYRPLKGTALQLVLDNAEFPSPTTASYLYTFNADAVLVIMIESPTGVANLPDMLAVGGVDGVLTGPHDSSISHGIAEQYDHPTFNEAVQSVIAVCREMQVGVGIHLIAGDMTRAQQWISWECNFIVHRSDTNIIASGIRAELGKLRALLDDEPYEDGHELGASGHAK